MTGVRKAGAFARTDDDVYGINPQTAADYTSLVKVLDTLSAETVLLAVGINNACAEPRGEGFGQGCFDFFYDTEEVS
ncbi:MAG: hypothetical protein D3904_09000, partial [Candidatus Electrothrix sp. EH2]|nr:hypothetical protein [Candidatus Electrothrix sp. EH2]